METERKFSPQPPNRKKLISIFLVAIGCLIVALHIASENPFMEDRIEITNDTGAGLRRRLETSRKLKSYSVELHYLSLGGPLTYGRGLDEHVRPFEAYPHRLSSNNRNVATYEASGPTSASLCTQSIVEDATNASIEYDVITLEYSFRQSDTSKEVYLSSMELLVQRLHQRYPHARIVLVQISTPSDLVRVDKTANNTLSYEEWWNSQRRQPTNDSNEMITDGAPFEWSFRQFSQTEQQVQEQMEAMMASVGGLVAKMPQPNNWRTIVDNWFLEESNNEEDGTDSFRYTLSLNGHEVVAKSIRDALRKHGSTESIPHSFSSSPEQLLFSWGSGDACHLWYDTGNQGLPNPKDYSSGLSPREIDQNSYALEVTSSQGGTLQIYNPFDTERLVYLTYLTASGLATSNKVYPKTKVKIVAQGQQQGNSQSTSRMTSATSVLLDPSHSVTSQHRYHYTRTSAVGIIPSHQTGMIQFTALEEYTIHPFRIVGVSILHAPEKMRFETQLFAPRKLSIDT